MTDKTPITTSSGSRGLLRRAFAGDVALSATTLVTLSLAVLQTRSLPLGSELITWFPGIVLVLAIWAMQAGPRRITDTAERRFWNTVALAFFAFLIAELFQTFFLEAHRTILGQLFQQLCYLAFYLLLLFAIELQPHRVIPESHLATWRSRRRFEIEGATLFVIGLVVSFVWIPIQVAADDYNTFVSSYCLYVSLDLLVLIRTFHASRSSRGVRWRTIYRYLLLAEAAMFTVDLGSLLDQASLYKPPPGLSSTWYLYFSLFVLAARIGHFLPPVNTSERKEQELGDELPRHPFSNILLIYTLLLPALHLLFEYFAVFDLSVTRQRIPIVLIYIFAFLYIIGRQHRFEESRNLALEAQVAQRQAVVVEQRDQLLRTNAELERLTYTVNHDLKSPLVTILGFVGMLERDMTEENPDRMKSDMQRIRGAASRMSQMVDELVELSRIGHVDNEIQAVSLGELA